MNDSDTRIADVDALRGFALFGILVVNITSFASTYYGTGVDDPSFAAPLDKAVRYATALLFETKFYLLFSFLFGYSFTLQMASAERAGAAFVPRLLRRLAGLWTIGVLHAALLYHGDILTTYAVLGLVLLALRRLDADRAVTLAAQLVAFTAIGWAVVGGLILFSGVPLDDPATMSGLAATARAAELAYRGSVADVIGQRVDELGETVFVLLFVQVPCAFAMFLCGYVVGRRQLLVDPMARRAGLARLVRCGFAIGLPGAVLYATSNTAAGLSGWNLLGLAAGLATAPFLSAAYAASLLFALHARGGAVLRDWLAPAGRMALSNYLLQSAVCAWIYTGYGLAQVGRLAPLPTFGVAVAIFAAQLVVSRRWLRRYAYGPAEWALRAVTLARLPALRRRTP